MLKYLMMKIRILLFVTAVLTGCSPQGRAFLVRSYDLHPSSSITSEELIQRMRSNPDFYIIIDTRPAEEYAKAHIKGAISYPKNLMNKDTDFDKGPLAGKILDKPLLIYNEKGSFYGAVRRFLDSKIFQPMFFLDFGFSQWIGDIEGSGAEEALEQNRKKNNAYRL